MVVNRCKLTILCCAVLWGSNKKICFLAEEFFFLIIVVCHHNNLVINHNQFNYILLLELFYHYLLPSRIYKGSWDLSYPQKSNLLSRCHRIF